MHFIVILVISPIILGVLVLRLFIDFVIELLLIFFGKNCVGANLYAFLISVPELSESSYNFSISIPRTAVKNIMLHTIGI